MNQFIDTSGFITTIPISNSPYKLSGVSTAANETGFEVIGMGGVSLDAGISTHNTKYMFITHSHYDHIKNITSTILNCESDKKRTSELKIYCPKGSYSRIEDKIIADYTATKHCTEIYELPCELIGISPGDTVEIYTAGKTYLVTAINCTHSIACTGYGFTEVRNKVTPEHLENIAQLTQEQKSAYFKDMESRGINCYEKKMIPLFVYLGDTTHKVFNLEGGKIFEFPTIIVECTFLKFSEIKKAKDDKHMHWNNLKPIILNHPDVQFILYHFSARYKNDEIRDFFDSENISNVTPFVNYGINMSILCKQIHNALCFCTDLAECKTYRIIIEQQNIAKGITEQPFQSNSASKIPLFDKSMHDQKFRLTK